MEKIRTAGSTVKGVLIAGFAASLLLNWALWDQVVIPKHHHQMVTCESVY